MSLIKEVRGAHGIISIFTTDDPAVAKIEAEAWDRSVITSYLPTNQLEEFIKRNSYEPLRSTLPGQTICG